MLSAFVSLMMLYIVLMPIPETTSDSLPEVWQGISYYEYAKELHAELQKNKSRAKAEQNESAGHFTEEVSEEMNCLMYATIPIGRYYITAYNHEETGSKITASGKTCHEGTITTAAADVPKYLKFGEVIEVYVNGEPRLYIIEDTGSAVKKKHVDLYFSSYSAMARYGSNWQNISKVEFPFGKPKEA